MGRVPLQTFKNNNGPTRKKLGEFLAVFRRKYVKPQSMATGKQKFWKLVFNSTNQKLVDFLDELQKLAKDAFGIADYAIIEQFKYAKKPPQLKKSISQAHLENGTYEQIVTHIEKELELNGLEAPDELHRNTVSHNTANTSADRHKPTCHRCKTPGHYRNQSRLLKKQREQIENLQNIPGKKNSDANASNPNSNVNKKTTRKKGTEPKESRKLFTHPVRYVEKQTSPQRYATLEPMQLINRLPFTEDGKDRIMSQREPMKKILTNLIKLHPKIRTKNAMSSLPSCD